MAELIPNALNSDLPNYWKDLSGIDFNVKIDETFYGKTQHYYTTASYEQFKILSEYEWNLGDPCGEGTLGELSVNLNNFFTFLRGIQQYSSTYIRGSINMIQNVAAEISKVSEAIAAILKTLIQRVRNWILNKIRELIDNALESLLTPLTKQIKEGLLQQIIEQLACSFDDIIDGLVDFVGDFLYALVGQIIQTPLCAVENYLNAMLNRLSSDIEDSIQPFLNQLNDVLGQALSIVGQVDSIINKILGYEAFFCARPECPEVKNFKASIWGGPTPSAIANFSKFTASPTGFVDTATTKAEEWLADFFGPDSNTSQSPGACYTGTFKCGLPQVVIFGGGGSGAAANAVVNAIGEVIGVNLLDGGSGYTSPPFVSIVDPGGCGINASATAILCPPSSTSKSPVVSGYRGPGIYLNLISAKSSSVVIGWNGVGIYLDLTSATPIDSAGTVVVTFTLIKSALFVYSVSIPGTTISGAKIPPLPYPSADNVPVQISMNLKAGEIYGPIVKTGDPGTLYVGDQVVAGVINSGSLTNTSIVVETGGDDWNDYVISTNGGFFASYSTPPPAPTTTTTSTAPINVIFTTTGSEVGYSVDLPISKTTKQTLTGPGFPGNRIQRSVSLVPGKIYGPLSISSGSGKLYVGNEKVAKISSSGSLSNTSVVIEKGGDDWDDYILSTNHGFFETYNTSPNSKKKAKSSKRKRSVCSIGLNNPGSNYSNSSANGSPVIQVFTGSPNPVDTNNTITLSWSILNATSASLNVPGFSNISLVGNASVLVNPAFPVGKDQTTITYTITATNDQPSSTPYTVTKDFILTVNKPFAAGGFKGVPPVLNTNTPTIDRFEANPTKLSVGQVVNITWETTDAKFASLSATGFKNPLIGYSSIPEDGTLSFVMPPDIPFPAGGGDATIEYELIATNPDASGAKTDTDKISITVSPTPAPPGPAAPGPGPAAPGPVPPIVNPFVCTPSATTVNEGDTMNFTVTNTDPADNGTFYYEIISISGSVTDSDFSDNTLTGSFTIAGNRGTISKTISNDLLTEGVEQFNLLIKRDPLLSAFLATSGGIIINDTSSTPIAPLPLAPLPLAPGALGKFTCTPSTRLVNEGDTIDFDVTTTDPADNGTFYYQIIPLIGSVTASDFTDLILSGSFTITSNKGTISKTISNDALTEGTEDFQLVIKRDLKDSFYRATSGSITIKDTSLSPPGTPAIAVIGSVLPIAPGSGYPPGTTITAPGGAILKPIITPGGSISGVTVVNPGYGFTRIPELQINSREGLGAKLRVNLEFIPLDQFLRDKNLESVDPAKLVRIIDCVSR